MTTKIPVDAGGGATGARPSRALRVPLFARRTGRSERSASGSLASASSAGVSVSSGVSWGAFSSLTARTVEGVLRAGHRKPHETRSARGLSAEISRAADLCRRLVTRHRATGGGFGRAVVESRVTVVERDAELF